MNKELDYYRFSGNPAVATITIVGLPATGNTVTIGGVVFTFGTDVFPGVSVVAPDSTPRGSFQRVAEALCAAINCDKTRADCYDIGVHSNPFRPFYAIYYGNIVRLVAANPGTLGSTIALATNASAAFTISGAAFTGGGEGAAVGAGDASAANQVTILNSLNALLARTLDTSTATRVSSTALVSGLILKGSPGRLVTLIGYNNGPIQWIQLYNTTTVPADTAVPVCTIRCPAQSNFSFDFPDTGLPMTVGICASNSSTIATKTVGANDCYWMGVII